MWAMGVKEEIVGKLKEAWGNKTPVDDFIHKKMMEVYRLYLIVGGMPAAVNSYKANNNL